VQTAGGSISKLVRDFPGLHVAEIDGTDPIESYAAGKEAVDYVRQRRGPALIHAHVVRPYSHSLSDDEKLYKTAEEREEEAHRDPLSKFSLFLVSRRLARPKEIEALEAEVDREVREAGDQALAAEPPSVDSILVNIYSPDVDPTSPAFGAQPQFHGAPKTMVEMVAATLSDEMARDERITVFRRRRRRRQPRRKLETCKREGRRLQSHLRPAKKVWPRSRLQHAASRSQHRRPRHRHGHARTQPVAEIQFFDYIWPAMMQIRDELCVLRWRSNGSFKCPAVLRVAIGGYLTGGGIYHSQSGESIFTHCPGLRVVMPSTALDVAGLLRTAVRCDDPVMFLEHKHLYRQPYNRSEYPGTDYTVPFGKARMVKEGSDVSIITFGAIVHRAEVAAAQLEREGVSVEIIDLRSLSPYDWDAIAATVRKNHRVIVAYEDMLSWGFGAEIAARIADELFEELDAPVKRVAAMDTFCAYQPKLEDVILPQTEHILTRRAPSSRLLMCENL